MLKIDRTNQEELSIEQNDTTYTGKQMNGVLKMLDDGNKHAGGLSKPRSFFGIAGQSFFYAHRTSYLSPHRLCQVYRRLVPGPHHQAKYCSADWGALHLSP